jgi:hypothetical protein
MRRERDAELQRDESSSAAVAAMMVEVYFQAWIWMPLRRLMATPIQQPFGLAELC